MFKSRRLQLAVELLVCGLCIDTLSAKLVAGKDQLSSSNVSFKAEYELQTHEDGLMPNGGNNVGEDLAQIDKQRHYKVTKGSHPVKGEEASGLIQDIEFVDGTKRPNETFTTKHAYELFLAPEMRNNLSQVTKQLSTIKPYANNTNSQTPERQEQHRIEKQEGIQIPNDEHTRLDTALDTKNSSSQRSHKKEKHHESNKTEELLKLKNNNYVLEKIEPVGQAWFMGREVIKIGFLPALTANKGESKFYYGAFFYALRFRM